MPRSLAFLPLAVSLLSLVLSLSPTLAAAEGTTPEPPPAVSAADAPTTVSPNIPQRPRIAVDESKWQTIAPGIQIQDLSVGNGETPKEHDVLHMHVRAIDSNGTVVNDTLAQRALLRYAWHQDLMPKEFDKALETMRVGGKRVIRFSPPLRYNLGYRPVYADALPQQVAEWFEITLYRSEDLRGATTPRFK
jgi:hypothetical protein